MKKICFELFYEDFGPFKGWHFDESYQKWISETCDEKGITVEFCHSGDSKSIKLHGNSMQTICSALVFIGYAYGQADNGR